MWRLLRASRAGWARFGLTCLAGPVTKTRTGPAKLRTPEARPRCNEARASLRERQSRSPTCQIEAPRQITSSLYCESTCVVVTSFGTRYRVGAAGLVAPSRGAWSRTPERRGTGAATGTVRGLTPGSQGRGCPPRSGRPVHLDFEPAVRRGEPLCPTRPVAVSGSAATVAVSGGVTAAPPAAAGPAGPAGGYCGGRASPTPPWHGRSMAAARLSSSVMAVTCVDAQPLECCKARRGLPPREPPDLGIYSRVVISPAGIATA